MKKFLWIWASLLLIGMMPAHAKQTLTLEDIANGKYRSERMRGITPMADGESYLQMNPERTKIIKYSFKTGEAIETIFDVATARECHF